MTVTMKNVDTSFLDVLKSLLKIQSTVEISSIEDDSNDTFSVSEQHIQQINRVYSQIPVEEQTFTCNAGREAIWEQIKNDTW